MDNEVLNMDYPLMPLRDIVIFPNMVAPLVVGRKKSIKALETAMEGNTEIFLVTQKDAGDEDPSPDRLHRIGTMARVMQLLRLPDGTIKALVEGKRRGRILEFIDHPDHFMVRVEEVVTNERIDSTQIAYVREIIASFEEYVKINRKVPKEVCASLAAISDPARLVDVAASHLPLQTREKQTLLESFSVAERLKLTFEFLRREIEVANLEQTIRKRVKQKMEKQQKDYYLSEQMRAIQQEMGGADDSTAAFAELEKAIKEKKLPEAAQAKVDQEFKKLKLMPPVSAEATVVRNYIDTILSLPWFEKTEAKIDIQAAERILNEDHYGLRKPKERILEYLAVQTQVKKIRGPILCLVGPPGVGKTSLCKSIARSMGREYVRLSLGGVRDEAEIRGHRRTYIGALPGKILQMMQKIKVNNPLFCLDEVDKMSMDFRGDPSAALLEVLDPEQNFAFNDHYLEVDYDLSSIFFVTTANSLHAIPVPLQDRMEIIKLDGYTEEDSLQIAQGFLAPKQLEINGFEPDAIYFSNGAILEIIRHYCREAGVRELERKIAAICRKVARDRLKTGALDKKYRVSAKSIAGYLGIPRYRFGLAESKDEIGLSTGLAWTEVGGELLQIETTLLPGKGKLMITGKLGDVMQESAQAALSYVRSRAMRLGLLPDFYQKLDIHLHVPEGAIPKDGPSAGITIAASLVSALLQVPVRRDLAMTGEITLRGRVLPIGGLTEKLLAARRGNIKHVLIPKENERTLKEVPAKVRSSLVVELVDHMDQVLEKALVLKDDQQLFVDVPLGSICPEIIASTENVAH
ncbi:MAG: endopeptidase La [Desulfobacterales bacterium]|nr:endopeptidase La [Desulfobacterales bacterium]